jgi:putative peptidoglycan lipid II flippase
MKRFSALAALAVSDLGTAFLLQTYVLITVGVGTHTDAYFAGQAAPIVLLAILQLPLQRAVVVAFADRATGKFPAVQLLVFTAAVVGALLLLICITAPWSMRLLFPQLPAAAHDIGVSVLRAQSLAVLFSSMNLVLLALNQTRGRFVQCELSVLSSTLIAGCFVVFAVHHFGILAAAYGQIIKAVASTFFLGWMLRNSLDTGVPPWKEIRKSLGPMIFAGMLTKLSPIIDRSIGSAATSGSLSVLVFGQNIYNAATGVAERTIVAPRLPALKRGFLSVSPVHVAWQLAAAGVVLVIVMIPASALLFSIPAVTQKVGRENLDLLIALLIGLGGFPVGALTVQWIAAAIVVLGRPELSARIVTAGFLGGVACKYVGFHLGGIHGLAVGISVYYLSNALAFLLVLRHMMRAAPIDK